MIETCDRRQSRYPPQPAGLAGCGSLTDRRYEELIVSDSLSKAGLARLEEILAGHVARDAVPGLVWLVARHGEVHTGALGVHDDTGAPVTRDAIFRISSMTKPITAVAALLLVEDCVLRLDEPVDGFLPELADRRVLAPGATSLDDTVPAARPITLHDLLTFRSGWGMDFTNWDGQLTIPAMGELDLGAGPPQPGVAPAPDEWLRRLGTLPLEHQPGERWLYHSSADILGALITRAAGRPFAEFLRERLFGPLGMRDTAFAVPAADAGRLGPCYGTDPVTGERVVFDASDGRWSRMPAFTSGGDGLVSTVDDYAAFAAMLRSGGVHEGRRILSRASILAMTTNHLSPAQLADSSPTPTGDLGWGFGLSVQVRRRGLGPSVGTYGWAGGLGTSWANDPAEDLTGILLTNQMFSSPAPPPVVADFWTCAYTALDA
jgi:CubicO group peptidase (beta-lactamase class C family)